MEAVVFHDVGDIRLDIVSDPGLRERTDTIVRITSFVICGTDLHIAVPIPVEDKGHGARM